MDKTNLSTKKQLMVGTIKKYHNGQFRIQGNKVPYWYHCQSVAEIVDNALEKTGEIDNSKLVEDIFLAGLGHDLYEDTDISRDEIKLNFGPRVDDFIFNMTNEEDDYHRQKYLKKLSNASEEVKLIKFGDMIDNTIGCAYNIHDLGVEWVENFLLPIMNDNKGVIRVNDFIRYSKTAALLQVQFDFCYNRLKENLQKYQ